jgi:nucleotide-binding universal stress UspA family protein
MLNVLVPVSGIKSTVGVVEYLGELSRHAGGLKVHLLHVAPRLTRHAARWTSQETRIEAGRARARQSLTPIAERLRAANIDVSMHATRGELAESIATSAKELGCKKIVMGSRRRSSLGRLLDNSVMNRVMNATTLPVAVVPGTAATLAERVAVPSGVGAALLILALD